SVRLWRSREPRIIKPECQSEDTGSTIGFADAFPMLLVSYPSIKALRQSAAGFISYRRFRPNIVVAGKDLEPYAEDCWRRISIGGRLSAVVVRACARCSMPNIDQGVGILPKPADRFVTDALRRTRVGIDPLNGREEVFFGQNLTVVSGTESR